MQGRSLFSFFCFKKQLLPVMLGIVMLGTLPSISWNDASRLATVESLVDFHTWQIDQSVFQPLTGDKLFIHGHYYSDKSPVPALAMAALYQVLQWSMNLKAGRELALFQRFGVYSRCSLR
jgi:hypothetical protein